LKDGVLTREHHYSGIFYPKTNSEIISTINKFFHQINESPKKNRYEYDCQEHCYQAMIIPTNDLNTFCATASKWK